ncbi:hydroxysteroid 17-beta dehydrogenase 12 spidey [Musca autumnalis]|uniref:hydroxysteroid 17-beta dehydrogenase 12 spidey n=1 Tax=Musca autumnalis TaxID=221902 RepID=UPI003CF233C6
MDFDTKCMRIVGTAAVSIVGYQLITKFLPWLYMNIIGPKFFGPKVDVRRMGTWAVVTGATDGIGKAYAKALAKKGLNIVLISRTPSKLEAVAKEISEAYSVETKIIDVNFTGGPEIYDKIRTHIQGLNIGVLVNNVGMSYEHPEFFVEFSQKNPKFLWDIISANVHSVTQMTALVLPAMVEKKKGVIINISSTAGVIPNPLLSVYSATKAFVDKFSADLQTEYRARGIFVQSIQPGFVATNMTKIRKTSTFAPSADTYVASALSTLGIAERTAGYLPHTLLQNAINGIGYITCEQFASQIVFKNLFKTRQRALRNVAKKQ